MIYKNMIAENFNFLWKYYKDKQTELAKMFCVSQSNISDYVNGKRDIPIDVLDKIVYRYNVTIDDLKNKDLSLEYCNPQTLNIEQSINIGSSMFPFLTSNIAKNDDNFNRAYEVTKNILSAENINIIDNRICIFEQAVELYKKSWEESKTYVALSNTISLILTIYTLYSQQTVEIAQSLISKGNLDVFEILQSLLRDPNKSDAVNPYESKRRALFEKYHDLVFDYIKILKSNTRFSDLGDFYLAMCYLQRFADYDFDYDSCIKTAVMMLAQQVEIGNHYAEKFLEHNYL